MTKSIKAVKDEIKILDAVTVIEDLPEFGLKRGEVVTVVDAWKDGAFKVEFSDESGEAYAFVALQAEKLMPLYYRHREAA
jgi:hypothetical protein